MKRLAAARGIEVFQPGTLKDDDTVARVMHVRADALVVAAYGLLLPQAMLNAAAHGAINIHASLLPRWRGAAPIERAILAGDRETGVSIMKMDAGLDTGPVLAQRRVSIAADDDAGTLHDTLAALGAEMIVAALEDIAAGRAHAVSQPPEGVSYAPKITKAEMRLDWSRSAVELERAVRAFRPQPGASAMLAAEPVKIWRAHVVKDRGAPGEILSAENALTVACGEGALAITELQRPGARRLSAADFLRGRPLKTGMRFE